MQPDDCVKNIIHSYPINLNDEAIHRNPISHAQVRGMDFFLLNDSGLLEHVFQNHENFQRVGIFAQMLKEYLGNGIASIDGKIWQRQRNVIRPALGKKVMDDLVVKMANILPRYLDALERERSKNPVVDMFHLLMSLTTSGLCENLFSTTLTQEQIDEFLHAEENFSTISASLAVKRSLGEPIAAELAANAEKFKKYFDDFAYNLIRQRRQRGSQPEDFLQSLLNAQAQDKEITDEEIRDEIMAVLIGGHDTCGNNLSWAFYLISKHPDIEQSLRNEALKFNYGGVDQLKYTIMVFKEGLRIFPPAFMYHRSCINGDSLGGYQIPKGAVISICPWLVHRNSRYWQDPYTFDPNRFSNGVPPHMAYLPFGAGTHVCPGQGFALIESAMTLAAFFRDYHFEVVPQQVVQAYGGFTLRPRYGLKMKVTKLS